MRGEARNARIELRVGEAPLAGEVDHRLLVRRPAAEMRDPVVVANRQGFLRRSAVLRRLIDHKHAPDRGGLASRHFQDWAGRVPMPSCVEWLRRSQTQLVDLAAPCARHCEPTGRRKAPPDDRLREAIHGATQRKKGLLRRFRLRSLSYGGQVAPRNDVNSKYDSAISRRDASEFFL